MKIASFMEKNWFLMSAASISLSATWHVLQTLKAPAVVVASVYFVSLQGYMRWPAGNVCIPQKSHKSLKMEIKV